VQNASLESSEDFIGHGQHLPYHDGDPVQMICELLCFVVARFIVQPPLLLNSVDTKSVTPRVRYPRVLFQPEVLEDGADAQVHG